MFPQINISAKEEDLLWRSGQLGNQSALALLNVNLLNLVKRMGIKGRKDLYMLRVEDFEVTLVIKSYLISSYFI